jgi:cytochrome c-type biogenesis protein CcmH
MLSLLLALIVFAILVLILLPMLRGGAMPPETNRFDQAVYRDQLRELERDIARGMVNESEAAGARLEIQRRLLAAAGRPDSGLPRRGRSPVMAGVVALVISGGSIGLYLLLGAPTVPDMPIASRKIDIPAAGAGAEQSALLTALTRLRERLAAEPSNGELWLLYARTTASLDQWENAADGYRRAIDLGQKGPEVLSAYGEMLVLQARGVVTPAARAALIAAQNADPKSDVARYYLALAAGQAGETGKAINMLQGLVADMPEDSPMRGEVGKRIAETAKAAGMPVPALAQGRPPAGPGPNEIGPDAAMQDAAAKMPENERKDMIRAMVARLAARMETSPNDLDGWLRLARAYSVLGEANNAADAYDHAAALQPGEIGIVMQGAQALLAGLKPTDPIPARAVALLRQVEIIAPDQPEVLWYLGLAAARDAKPDVARGYWTRLRNKLPPNGEDAKTINAAIDALAGR